MEEKWKNNRTAEARQNVIQIKIIYENNYKRKNIRNYLFIR